MGIGRGQPILECHPHPVHCSETLFTHCLFHQLSLSLHPHLAYSSPCPYMYTYIGLTVECMHKHLMNLPTSQIAYHMLSMISVTSTFSPHGISFP